MFEKAISFKAHSRSLFFLISGFFLFFSPVQVSAQLWTAGSNPSVGSAVEEISAFAIDRSGLYAVGSDGNNNYQWRIEKRNAADGTLVSSFGSFGVVTNNPSGFGDMAYAVTVDDAGDIYVGGYDSTGAGSTGAWRIEKRSGTSGNLVSAFGSGGVVSTAFTFTLDEVQALAYQSGALYTAGNIWNDSDWRIERRNPTNGSVVWSQTSGLSGINNKVYDIIVDPRYPSYIYVAGTLAGDTQWRIEKRNISDGTLVASFGTSGVLTVDTPAQIDRLRDIDIEGESMYIASSNDFEWRIEKRWTFGGVLDATFGTGGVVTNALNSGGSDYAEAINTDSSYIFIAGNLDQQWRIEKRDATTGALVSNFGTNGVHQTSLAVGCNSAYAMAYDYSGIYVGGDDTLPASCNDSKWRIEKYEVGVSSSTWTKDMDNNIYTDKPYAISTDGSAGIFIAGFDSATTLGDTYWRVEKRDITSGALIPSFGAEGVVRFNPVNFTASGEPNDIIYSIKADATGFYAVGTDINPGNGQWRIEKRDLTTGALIWVVFSDPSSALAYHDASFDFAINSTAMYVVGYDRLGISGDSRWRIEKRDLATGALVPSFGTSGVVTSDMGQYDDVAYAIAIDGTGIYVTGKHLTFSSSQWRIEKRDLTTGALIPSFGTGGAVSTGNPLMNMNDTSTAIAIDGTGIYVTSSDNDPASGGYQWRIEKRDLTTGALIPSFGTGGEVLSNPIEGGQDMPEAIAIDSTGIYVTGTDMNSSGNRWRIEKRDLATGALDGTFGTGGVTMSSPGTSSHPYAIAVDNNGVYVAGSVYVGFTSDDYKWRTEKYSKTASAPPTVIDCGLRFKGAASAVVVACEPAGTLTSALRIRKGGTTYGVILVDVTDSNASPLRVRTATGVKALRRF